MIKLALTDAEIRALERFLTDEDVLGGYRSLPLRKATGKLIQAVQVLEGAKR